MILASFGIHRVPYATNHFDSVSCETCTQSKGKRTGKWFDLSTFPHCVVVQTNKQTQIETQRIFQFQFSSLYSFQCNNQRNIKAGSEYPTPTKFVLQRHKFLLSCNQTKYFPLSTTNVLYYTYTLWFRLNPTENHCKWTVSKL